MTVKTWIASAALVGGAGGGAAAGLAATDRPSQPAAAVQSTAAVPDVENLQQQIDALLQEDRALESAIRAAKVRLAGQVKSGEQSLAALHQRILAAQAELAQAEAARNQVSTSTSQSTAQPPSSHTTTGASGAGTSSGDGGHDGGGDD